MPRKAAAATANARACGTSASISDYLKGAPATTPKARPNGKAVSKVVDEFDGIEEISETDYTADELRRSAQRNAQRALKHVSSNAPSSSRAGPSSAPTLSDELEPEHIDLSGLSSPVRRSPRKHTTLSSSAVASSSKPSSQPSSLKPSSKQSSGRTRSPSPPVRRSRRRVMSSDDDDDDDVPLSRLTAKAASKSASPSKTPSSRKGKMPADPDEDEDEDVPTPAARKGKGRADPDEEYEDDFPFMALAGADSPENYDDGWDENMADLPDFNYDNYEPIDIPDFEILPSTQALRSRTQTPIYISDDELPQPGNKTPRTVKGAAARAAALAASFSPVKDDFENLTLISDLPPALREFYENHFRRGADQDDDDDDPDDFGVAAVVPKRVPARGKPRGRGGWRGGRGGRGGKRGAVRRKK